jgi:hypothetical protein
VFSGVSGKSSNLLQKRQKWLTRLLSKKHTPWTGIADPLLRHGGTEVVTFKLLQTIKSDSGVPSNTKVVAFSFQYLLIS